MVKQNCKKNNSKQPNYTVGVYLNDRKIFISDKNKRLSTYYGWVLKSKKVYATGFTQHLFNKKYKFKQVKSKQNKPIVLLLSGLIIGFINGFWGGGGGMVCVPTLTNFFKLPEKKAHATAILIMFPLSLVSFLVYYFKGNINFENTGFIISGFFVGAIGGALLLKQTNNLVLKLVFSLIIIAGGLRLLF